MITHEVARKEAEKIVSAMTLAEKIDQVNYTAPAIERLGIPDYNYWNEGLHGVARAGVATVFPQAIGLAAMFDEELMKEVAEVISTEGRAKYNQYHAQGDNDIYKGLTYWSPNINIFRDPRWGRGQETYGEDPYLTARLGVAFIKGLQGDGPYLKLAACAKHFAVHSGPEADRHSFDAQVSQKDLWETYLPAFQAAVEEADVESFMGAYNAVNGIPACVHPYLLKDVLRGEWNFKGHVVSDYGALEDVHLHHKYVDTPAETMSLAMKIGCNLCAGHVSDYLFEAYQRGMVSEEEITQAVVSLFTTRVRLGMFTEDNPYDHIDYLTNDHPDHHRLSLETAEKSMVLLENKDFLPLKKDQLKTVAVVGPNARNIEALQGNYFGTPSKFVTFLEGIQTELADQARVLFAKGSHLYNEHAESSLSRKHERESEALIAGLHADVIVACLGLDPTIEGEQGDAGNVYGSGDKPDLFLPKVQRQLLEKLLELNKPVVVVVAAGSAISLGGLEKHPNLKALIHSWYPGAFGGTALANILFGKTNPSGKLPVTFYESCENLPDFSDYALGNRTYRYLTDQPLYPFGYGLTYSTIELDRLEVRSQGENIQVSCEITNTSDRSVEEVVQVYFKLDSVNETPNGKLVGFKRVAIGAGESQVVHLTISHQELSVVNEEGNRVLDSKTGTVQVATAFPCQRSLDLGQVAALSTQVTL